ncbi:MAG TPA: DsbA family protein [Alphaproteobacteria bacterium]|nr:DsbA family protein [Alphaproteobacteria bacterium]HOO50597.1 DsbA family protein [Alphaproteobacteria bacterium]
MPKPIKKILRVIFITLGILILALGVLSAYVTWDANRALEQASQPLVEQVMGNPMGEMKIVEFVDYRCHFCPIMNDTLTEALVFEKDVMVIIRPVAWVDQESLPLAKFVLATRKQGKFLDLHKALMAEQGSSDLEKAKTIARSLGIDVEKAEQDAQAPEVEAQLQDNQGMVLRSGFPGIPALIVGGRQYFVDEEKIGSVNALRLEISDAYDRLEDSGK